MEELRKKTQGNLAELDSVAHFTLADGNTLI